ncbi:MAG: alpha/beta fold hydrolase [Halioglobus sp.]
MKSHSSLLSYQHSLGCTRQSIIALVYLALGLFMMGCSDNGSAPAAATPTAVEEPVDTPDEVGPYSVGHMRMEFIDVLRGNRVLPADIWYPADEADTGGATSTIYPLQGPLGIESDVSVDDVPVAAGARRGLLVFSHGFGGTNTQSIALMEHLASHGFVIVSPEHTGNTNSDNSDSNARAKRVPDVSFIIDSLLGLNDIPGEHFFETIDENKIGVLGHSGGGFTSLGTAAGYVDSPADKRVKAIMPVSAAIDGAYSAEDLAKITVPVLLLGGTLDTAVPIELNDFAFDALVNAPQVVQVDVLGATHTHFANICDIGNWLIDNGLTQDLWPTIGAAALTGPYLITCSEEAFPLEQVVRLQNLYATALFRFHLNGESGYEKFLGQEYAKSEPDINFKLRVAN